MIFIGILERGLLTRAQSQFNGATERAADAISDRANIYINALQGGKGLFVASETVEREEWKKYVDSLDIQDNYPGIQGIGYAIFVSPDKKDEHIAMIREEGFPDYTIRPEGVRDIYSTIIYLEPFDIRNQQAFGYDMFSNSIRRLAMEQARDSGEAWLSGRITLVQEIDNDDVQPGFLIYVPHYKNGVPHDTLSERL